MKRYLVLAIGLIVLGQPANQLAFGGNPFGEIDKPNRNDGIESSFVQDLASRLFETSKSSLIAMGGTEKQIESLLTKKNDEEVYKHLIEHIMIPDDAPLYLVGDLHGDMGPFNALIAILRKEGFCDEASYKLHADTHGRMPYVVFLGDYIDRGPDEFKVLDSLERFKVANPLHVHMLRGNHETYNQMYGGSGGTFESFYFDLFRFNGEGSFSAKEILRKFLNAFELLPAVLFIDRKNAPEKRIVCMHGAPEFQFNDFNIMTNKAPSSIVPAPGKIKIMDPFLDESEDVGIQQYLWNYLRLDKNSQVPMVNNMGYWISAEALKAWLDAQKTAVYFGGHQQEDFQYTKSENEKYKLFSEGPMFGVGYRVGWPAQVFKLNVAPRGGYEDKKRYKDKYYTEYGTFVCVDPVKKNGAFEYQVLPVYFDPETHKLISIFEMEQKIGRPIERVTLKSFIG